ncbi:MAG: hypothetical protein WCD89_17950 [Anaerocolumna sp.]
MKKSMIGFLAAVVGIVVGVAGVNYYKNKSIAEIAGKTDKFRDYYNLVNQWLVLKNEGKRLDKYFINHGYKSIAIYGMGELGNRLYEELKDSEIKIKYAIDKNAESTYSELEVIGLEEDMEEVDVIVVTATFAFEDIEEELKGKVNYQMISLEDVVYDL